MLSDEQIQRVNEIQKRIDKTASGSWRNTIRRESGKELSDAIDKHGRPGVPLCSQSVVNTESEPTAENVICWMGPAAGEHGDDLLDASFIANAKSDVTWLLALVDSLAEKSGAK